MKQSELTPMPPGRPPQIVHVIYSGLGGHSAVMFSLLDANFMQEAQHHVVLAGIEEPPEDYSSRLQKLGTTWTYVSKKEGHEHLDFYVRLRKTIFDKNTDVVFLHGVAAIPAVAMMMGRRRNGPVVILRETEPTQVKTNRVWAMLALAHFCTDAVVHLTSEAAADAQKKLKLFHRPSKVEIIANGLDTDFFCPSPIGKLNRSSNNTLRIGMQSRLQPTKDHITLIEAFAKLQKSHPEINLVLEVAGDGPTRPMIEQRICDLELNNSVKLHGMLSRDEVRNFLQGLDIYVHSSFGETQSNAIMQAMSVGLPIVACDVDGISNMIRSDLGLLHISGDSDDLALQISRLIDDPDLSIKFSGNARAQAQNVYGASASARSYERLIAKLLPTTIDQ